MPLAVRSPLLDRLQVFHSGPPAEPTGAVVAAVRERMAASPARIEAILDRIAAATHALRRQLEAADGEPAAFAEILAACHRALVELGVVPPAVRDPRRRGSRARGARPRSPAPARSPGREPGSLLVYHPDPERPATWSFLRDCRRYPVALGGPGLQLENAGEERSPP